MRIIMHSKPRMIFDALMVMVYLAVGVGVYLTGTPIFAVQEYQKDLFGMLVILFGLYRALLLYRMIRENKASKEGN